MEYRNREDYSLALMKKSTFFTCLYNKTSQEYIPTVIFFDIRSICEVISGLL